MKKITGRVRKIWLIFLTLAIVLCILGLIGLNHSGVRIDVASHCSNADADHFEEISSYYASLYNYDLSSIKEACNAFEALVFGIAFGVISFWLFLLYFIFVLVGGIKAAKIAARARRVALVCVSAGIKAAKKPDSESKS